MAETRFAAVMKEAAGAIHRDLLKPSGFKKQRSTFNRLTDDGLVQVVALRMGRHEFGEDIPPIRVRTYGSFTVDLGIYIPEVAKALGDYAVAKGFVPEVFCAVRKSLSDLGPQGEPAWWSLSKNTPEAIAAWVTERLREVGLPFLEGLATRDDLIAAWERHGRDIGLPPRAPLDIAAVHLAAGRRDRAEAVLAALFVLFGFLVAIRPSIQKERRTGPRRGPS